MHVLVLLLLLLPTTLPVMMDLLDLSLPRLLQQMSNV